MKSEEVFYPKSAIEWRDWLHENHETKDAVWLLYYKTKTQKPTVAYSDAVDEALCFGWIDSKIQSLEDDSYRQFFCKRKPKSVWSKVNKAKVERLIATDLMQPAGYKCIEIAKANGSWASIDTAEALEVPIDLATVLNQFPIAKSFFDGFSNSTKRNLLMWLILAKKEETRQKRIEEIVSKALENQKPKGF